MSSAMVSPFEIITPAMTDPAKVDVVKTRLETRGQTEPVKCFIGLDGKVILEDAFQAPIVLAARKLQWIQIEIEVR